MTTILQRYIAKAIILATGMTGLVFAALLFVMTLLTELKNVGEGDYGFSQAVIYVFMRMPAELYQFAPMLVLLGGIAGLSVLSTYRELAVMRASGFAVRQIVYSVLGATLLLTFMMGAVGEWVAPQLTHIAEINKENDKNGGQAVVTSAGVWLHVDHNFIHVEHVVGQKLLQGVTRYQFDDQHHLQAAYYAKTLSYQGDGWVMNDAVKTTFNHDHAQSEVFATAPWDLTFNINLLNIGLADPNEMSLLKLNRFADYLDQNGLRSSEYRYEFWQRVFQPLASLIMVFLAIPFVLGTLKSSTLGWRMVVGIMVGFVFFISNSFLGQICIVYQVPAMFAALLPIVVFLGIGMVMSRQMVRQ